MANLGLTPKAADGFRLGLASRLNLLECVELGGRVLAVAISDDGTHTAACVLGKGKGSGEVYVWQTRNPAMRMKPIHSQQGDFGFEPHACLTFSRDGKRLAGLRHRQEMDQALSQASPQRHSPRMAART